MRSICKLAEFRKLWFGQSVSLLGTEVGGFVMPLIAILVLQAGPTQMGIIGAARTAPFLLLGLLVGAYVDHVPRRPVLIAADWGRAILLLTIPAAAIVGVLRLEQVYAIVLLTAVCHVFFEVAHSAYLPSLIGRDRLVEANSSLEMSRAVAEVVGPGLGGLLVQLMTAPVALVADALSYAASAISLTLIHAREVTPTPLQRGSSMRVEITAGLAAVLRDSALRSLAASVALSNLGLWMSIAVYVLFLTRDLAFGPAEIGAVVSVGSAASVAGAAVTGPLARWLGMGQMLLLGSVLITLGLTIPPLAGSPGAATLGAIVMGQLCLGFGFPLVLVSNTSLRQALIPDHMLGRITAAFRTITWGVLPLASLGGGFVGDAFSLRAALATGAVVSCVAVVTIATSPVRSAGRAVAEHSEPKF